MQFKVYPHVLCMKFSIQCFIGKLKANRMIYIYELEMCPCDMDAPVAIAK